MDILIIGAGRMGIRHAFGSIDIPQIKQVLLIDVSDNALDIAKQNLADTRDFDKLSFLNSEKFTPRKFNFVIIASTAFNRIEACRQAAACDPDFILVEKPLAQSMKEVNEIIAFFKGSRAKVYVNLSMRQKGFIRDLKQDLDTWPQFKGPKTVICAAGAIGIGANAIHYLELLRYLLDANETKLIAGGIDSNLIPSGRGPTFGDFGGWCCIEYYRDDLYVGRVLITLSATSTVIGGWDIIGSHALIRINEAEGERVDIVRALDSTMPINRYGADYLPKKVTHLEPQDLFQLTHEWILASIDGKVVLPTLEESVKCHQLMFDWLALSSEYTDKFPIT